MMQYNLLAYTLTLTLLYGTFALRSFLIPNQIRRQIKNQHRVSLVPTHLMKSIFGTNLEGIVTTRAFISSLVSNLRGEITSDKVLMQLYAPDSYSIIYISISLIFVYGEWKFHKGSQSNQKFQKIESFAQKESCLKNIMFVVLFVFTKDVLSAS